MATVLRRVGASVAESVSSIKDLRNMRFRRNEGIGTGWEDRNEGSAEEEEGAEESTVTKSE